MLVALSIHVVRESMLCTLELRVWNIWIWNEIIGFIAGNHSSYMPRTARPNLVLFVFMLILFSCWFKIWTRILKYFDLFWNFWRKFDCTVCSVFHVEKSLHCVHLNAPYNTNSTFPWKEDALLMKYHRVSQEPLDQIWACLYSFWCIFHVDSKYVHKMLQFWNFWKFSDKIVCCVHSMTTTWRVNTFCCVMFESANKWLKKMRHPRSLTQYW